MQNWLNIQLIFLCYLNFMFKLLFFEHLSQFWLVLFQFGLTEKKITS